MESPTVGLVFDNSFMTNDRSSSLIVSRFDSIRQQYGSKDFGDRAYLVNGFSRCRLFLIGS